MNQTINYKYCNYHSGKLALTRCDKCKNYLCSTDIRLFHELSSKTYYGSSLSSIGESSAGIHKTKVYCLVCYSKELKKDLNPLKILITFIPLLLLYYFLSTQNQILSIGLLCFIMFFAIIYVFQIHKYITIRNKGKRLKTSLKLSSLSNNNLHLSK